MTDLNFRFLSEGWGVQTWKLLAQIALGEIEPVRAAIFSDTTHEKSETIRFAKEWTPWVQAHGVEVDWIFPNDPSLIFQSKHNEPKSHLPLYGYDENFKRARLKRQCTYEWKIRAVRKHIRTKYYPFKSDFVKEYGQPVRMLLGISTDEWTRAKSSGMDWIVNEYPLLDMNESREDCIRWLHDHNLPVPPKSACVHCPFHKRSEWAEMARTGGEDWEQAVRNDEIIRAVRPLEFVHRDMIPLREFEKRVKWADGIYQPTLAETLAEDFRFSLDDDDEEDPGMCDSGFCFM